MDTAAGDVVTVRGSLAELGNWGPGQVLEQHPENSNIWFVPFLLFLFIVS
jgi:hypothetical protein